MPSNQRRRPLHSRSGRLSVLATIGMALGAGLITPGSASAIPSPAIASPAPTITGPAASTAGPVAVIHVDGSATAPELTPAESEDVTRSAEQHGVDPSIELERARGTNQFAHLVTELQAKYPSIYVDEAWIPADAQLGETSAWISLTSTPPADLIAQVSTIGVPVDIRVVNSPSRLERLHATELAHFTATSALDTTDVVTTADSSSGVLTITTSKSYDQLETIIAAALAQEGLDGFTVRVVVAQGPVATPEQRGGMRFAQLGCTGAFSVKKGSVWGVTTAAHCGPSATVYENRAVTFVQDAGTNGDVEFYKFNSGTATSTFQFRLHEYRNVSAATNPVANQTTCNFGFGTVDYGTGPSNPSGLCSTVLVINACSVSACSAVIMAQKVTTNGDSGGPWYFGTEAKGTHVGEVVYLGAYRSAFSRISVLSRIGWAVVTS